MALVQIGFSGQGANVSDAAILSSSTGGYAVRALFDDAFLLSNAEALRELLVIEKAVEQDTFPSAFETGSITMYACAPGGVYETLFIGAPGAGSYGVRFIVDRTTGDNVTSKSKVLHFLHAIADLISTYKYPYS